MCMLIHMRTNIVLDDALVEEAMAITGVHSKKELVHHALKMLVETEHAAKLRARYDVQATDLQARTDRLVLRERPHDLVRADRNRH